MPNILLDITIIQAQMMNIEKKKKQIAEKKRKQAELAKRGQGDLKVSK